MVINDSDLEQRILNFNSNIDFDNIVTGDENIEIILQDFIDLLSAEISEYYKKQYLVIKQKLDRLKS